MEFLTLRVSPPAHPETTPRRLEVIREVGMHTEKQGREKPSYPKRGRKEEESEESELERDDDLDMALAVGAFLAALALVTNLDFTVFNSADVFAWLLVVTPFFSGIVLIEFYQHFLQFSSKICFNKTLILQI